jgi:hypothetical protein
MRPIIGDLILLAPEAAEDVEDLLAEVGLVDLEEEVGVAAVVHEVADALVHGDAGGGDAAGHGGDDRVEARADHEGAIAQHGDHVVHVVVSLMKSAACASRRGRRASQARRSSCSMPTRMGRSALRA